VVSKTLSSSLPYSKQVISLSHYLEIISSNAHICHQKILLINRLTATVTGTHSFEELKEIDKNLVIVAIFMKKALLAKQIYKLFHKTLSSVLPHNK
jgi:hypothetical protein